MVTRQIAAAGARVPRSLVLVVGCLFLGLAVGALLSSSLMSRRAARVSDNDYVLMVADLYDHEKSVFNARERLMILNRDPVDAAEAAVEAAQRGRPEAGRDLDALRQLAAALRTASAEQAAARGGGVGIVSVLALILASVVLAAGGAWIWRRVELRGTGGLRLPASSGTDDDGPGIGARARRMVGGRLRPVLAPTEANRPSRRDGGERNGRAHTPLIEEPDAAIDDPPRSPARRTPSSAARSDRRLDASTPRRPWHAPRPSSVVSFHSVYQLGDDPFDEIHPINDDQGEMIGACGFSATEAADRPGRYYGFTVWLQDHTAHNDLAAAGLVSRTGLAVCAARIADWQRHGKIDAVYPAERGYDFPLRTRGIAVQVTVLDFEYAPPSHGSPGYFGRLALRFDVRTESA